jgi:hypothetical protein|tara:strand:+ start:35266 stop:35511 length:246 start_codon:yes stop_codon:yes gene_type:complete
MSKRSLEELFDLIHLKQAEHILSLLESGELTAQEINAINKFLSDNSVTGVKKSNKSLQNLSAGLDKFNQSGNVAEFRKVSN